ncbi:MAG: amidase domain-containing protein [Sarcina sp.]
MNKEDVYVLIYKKLIPIFIFLSFLVSFYSKNVIAMPLNYLIDVEFIEKDNENLDDELYKLLQPKLSELFTERNNAILSFNADSLRKYYNLNQKPSLYAFENEAKKIKYLDNWCEKQGVTFSEIKTKARIKKIKEKEKNLYSTIVVVSTEFHYNYDTDENHADNIFRLGTYHYLNVKINDDSFIITKEWYTDPFADSLNLNDLKSEEIKTFIGNKQKPDLHLTDRVKKAVAYAHKYCGAAADDELGFSYNSKYTDFNPAGGDCANFASQILHEGGGFRKNATWNYVDGAGSVAWVNAQGFKNYMLESGRGSLIAKGTYSQVYKSAYNLRPGDFVAYEKKGRITHISTITGLDSKGYPLVTCHNTDRLLVPYDLGWSNPNITFHLIHSHY